ncbi:MAG: hypothetical protein GEU88_10325 [Solirubrobacterales bacterium]|nr:hypothetical protein [Solirubrobacterales bacterium]
MLGAGTVINPILKILTTVAILAAVSFFIVKPILDTTERTIDRGFENSQQLQQGVQGQVEESLDRAQRLADETGVSVEVPDSVARPDAIRLLRCVQRANQDVTRMQACTEHFTP